MKHRALPFGFVNLRLYTKEAERKRLLASRGARLLEERMERERLASTLSAAEWEEGVEGGEGVGDDAV